MSACTQVETIENGAFVDSGIQLFKIGTVIPPKAESFHFCELFVQPQSPLRKRRSI